MSGKGLQLKNTSLLVFSSVSKIFEKFVNNKSIDHLKKCGLFSDFQYCFRFTLSTVNLLTVVFVRITRALAYSSCHT